MLKRRMLRVLGAMSGTSLDGVDAAVLVTDGVTIAAFGETAYRPYSAAERAVLRAALGAWPDDPRTEAAAEVVETAHAELLSRFDPVDLVGFHGQTLAHDPGGRGTHQAGSGEVLATVLGAPVVWDFRSSDVRLGGQGAPLVPFYHHALARHIGATGPVAFLNIGGVANVTWTDPRIPAPDHACLAFDCGPGNAAMDDLMQARRGQPQDADGAVAALGTPCNERLDAFARHPFFRRIPPKSLDRAAPVPDIEGLPDADALATLAAGIATGVALAFEHFPEPPERLWVSGGGRHNRTVMRMIAAGCDCPTAPVEEAGLDGDMLEAQAFAWLAVRVVRGLPTSGPRTTGVAAPVGGGILSRPPDQTR
ncbi:anhydro-N-acetylmuramic acid kinase [Pararhodobacter sp.]|uniref:anhydro-N-acetylmuramic acid kinase n=1 Tax=Pararhodobacter sp. TaxID=2127056 RepID=UPI002FDCC874